MTSHLRPGLARRPLPLTSVRRQSLALVRQRADGGPGGARLAAPDHSDSLASPKACQVQSRWRRQAVSHTRLLFVLCQASPERSANFPCTITADFHRVHLENVQSRCLALF